MSRRFQRIDRPAPPTMGFVGWFILLLWFSIIAAMLFGLAIIVPVPRT